MNEFLYALSLAQGIKAGYAEAMGRAQVAGESSFAGGMLVFDGEASADAMKATDEFWHPLMRDANAKLELALNALLDQRIEAILEKRKGEPS